MADLLHKELNGNIIGAYYNVYNGLHQAIYPEYIYENAMMVELRAQNISCLQQDEYQVRYKDFLVGLQRLDIFVASAVVVELKVSEQVEPAQLAQLLSYIKTTDSQVGLLFLFGSPKPEFHRRIWTVQSWQTASQVESMERFINPDWLCPDLVYEVLGGLFDVFRELGPGFVHRIYARACYHELHRLRGLEVLFRKEMTVSHRGQSVGTIKFSHLQVEDKLLVFPVAISDVSRIYLNNLKAWMRQLKIPLGILANFYTTRLNPVIIRA